MFANGSPSGCSSQRVEGTTTCVCRRDVRVSVCCLLVLDSVTSTPQWIRQQKPRDGSVHVELRRNGIQQEHEGIGGP
jgi:hypothetical protein